MNIKWYFHPWRLFTLVIGIATLLYGAAVENAPDWDVAISFLMAGFTYGLMPLFDKQARGGSLLYAFLIGDWCVNGVYSLYWGFVDPSALVMLQANYAASWSLFLACWAVWSLVPQCVGQPFTKSSVGFHHLIKGRWGPRSDKP